MDIPYKNILEALAGGGKAADSIIKILDKELSLPNIPMQTLGGETFWINLAEYEGWRLQQNSFTKHCRILDPSDKRIAWGTKNGMIKALDSLVELQNKYQ